MTKVKDKERFLELRAQGDSLRTIEKKIGTSRHTLAKWEGECKEQIENLRAIYVDGLREEYRLTMQARIKGFGLLLKRATDELARRDLSDVSTLKLADLALKLDAHLTAIMAAPSITDDAGLAARKADRNLVESLVTPYATAQHASPNGDRGHVNADALVRLQVRTLQRFEAGEIDSAAASRAIAIINSIYKGIEVADTQERFDALERVLAGQPATM
ncbi:MAG: hypothetical protein WCE82_07470 [Halobacteriota archaeon]